MSTDSSGDLAYNILLLTSLDATRRTFRGLTISSMMDIV